MTVSELIRQLETFDQNSEVVINPDIKDGKYKSNPGSRAPRYSYSPDAITERSVLIGSIKENVVCIELGQGVGRVNPPNTI